MSLLKGICVQHDRRQEWYFQDEKIRCGVQIPAMRNKQSRKSSLLPIFEHSPCQGSRDWNSGRERRWCSQCHIWYDRNSQESSFKHHLVQIDTNDSHCNYPHCMHTYAGLPRYQPLVGVPIQWSVTGKYSHTIRKCKYKTIVTNMKFQSPNQLSYQFLLPIQSYERANLGH